MQFMVWVRQLAPKERALRPCSNVAVEWPRETRMDCDVRVPINGDDSSSSGATVTSLRFEREGP